MHQYQTESGWATVVLASVGIYLLRYRAKKISQARPLLEDHPGIEQVTEDK